MAVGLSTLILALLFTGLNVSRRFFAQQEKSARSGPAVLVPALRQWANELENAAYSGEDPPSFELVREPPNWTLRWASAQPMPELPEALRLVRLAYRFEQGDLFRIVHDPENAQDEKPRPLVSGLRSLDILFFDGETWTDHWPIENGPVFPQAVRIRLVPASGSALSVETSIPAGKTWSPTPAS